MVNRSQYKTGVPAEPLERYCPGGYHPIHLNDLLNDGQYEVLNKLGFGSFSTVWLAKDIQNQCNVAIKVIVATGSEANSRELQIMRCIGETGDPHHPGHKHVSQLLDSFYHDGPNGRHLCLVLELQGPRVSAITEYFRNDRLNGNLARRVSQQLLYATDYLHSCRIAHGDIHLGNAVFRIPDFAFQNPIEYLSTPSIGKVSRIDGAPREKGLPEYMVEPAEWDAEIIDFLNEVQLIDFGESFFFSSPPKIINTPAPLHPPELVFHRILTEAVDIWNLGSTTYELVAGRTPFESWFNENLLIPQFQKVIGGVPETWFKDAVSNGVLEERIDDSSAENFLVLEQHLREAYFGCPSSDAFQLGEGELEVLGHYLRKMLVVDPKERATSESLLAESWISNPA